MSSQLLWPILFIIGTLCIGGSLAGNCTNSRIVDWVGNQGTVVYRITNAGASAYPADKGEIVPGVIAAWDFFALIERNRTFVNVGGSPKTNPSCEFPSSDTADPFQPYDVNVKCDRELATGPCGAIESFFLFTELDCYMWEEEDIFYGAERKSVYVRLTNSSHPDFSVKVGYHIANETLNIYPFNNPEDEDALVNTYRAGILKLEYDIFNYPWAGPKGVPGTGNNSSFVAAHFTTKFVMEPGNLLVELVNYSTTANYVNDKNDTSFLLGFETGLIIDGVPYTFRSPYRLLSNVTFDQPLEYQINNAVSWCRTNVAHWKTGQYDPYLVAFFTGSRDVSAPTGAKGGLTSGQVAAIASVVPVVVITLITVVLVMRVEKFKAIFVPGRTKTFSRVSSRATTNTTTTTATTNKIEPKETKQAQRSTWSAGSKPNTIQ